MCVCVRAHVCCVFVRVCVRVYVLLLSWLLLLAYCCFFNFFFIVVVGYVIKLRNGKEKTKKQNKHYYYCLNVRVAIFRKLIKVNRSYISLTTV